MRLSDVLYVLGLIAVLLFAANCTCQQTFTKHTWVVCEKGPNGNSPSEFSAYGEDPPNSTPLPPIAFNAADWTCPNTTGSPIWAKSLVTIPPPPSPLAPPPEPDRRLGAKATNAGSAAYLPQPILDLPFPAQGPASQSSPNNCSPSQPDVLQVNHDNASVNRITPCPGSLVATIPVVTHPLQIAITPDGLTALVTSYDNAVNFINLSSNQVTFTLNTGSINPNGLAITPDGAFAYITNFRPTAAASSIAKIDLSSRTIVQTMPALSAYPQNLVLSPDGSQLYITYPYGNLVQIIDTLTNSQAAAFSVPAPRGIAFNSKGTKAYIAEAGNPDNATMGAVQEFDTNMFQLGATYQVGLGPNDIAVLYGDQFVITTNYEGQSVSKIDTVSGTVQTTPANGQVSGLSIVN